ncbi:MAG: peptide ABC transporter substrate-binding protein, partial [Planctomycetota bacterium]
MPRRALVLLTALLLAAGSLFILARLLAGGRTGRADFTFANGTDPRSLDPAKVTGSPEGRVLRALFEGLTGADPVTLAPRPAAAERWEISADGLRYTFHMREEARWSDGSPVTAHDFEWSWRRLLEPATAGQYSYLLWPVVGAKGFHLGELPWEAVGIRAPSVHLLEVELTRPVPYFLSLTSFFALFPVRREALEGAPADASPFTSPRWLVSNGPFSLAERRLRDRIRLRRNPRYWNRERVALRSIDILAVESSNTMLNLFLSGDAQWIVRVPRPVVPILMEDPRFARVFRPSPYFATHFLRINVTRPPFDDRELRRAFSLASDRLEIVTRVTRAGEEPAWSFVPWPGPAVERYRRAAHARSGVEPPVVVPVPWYSRACVGRAGVIGDDDPALAKDWARLGHDPEQARRILRSRGYRVPARRQDSGRSGGGASGFTAGRAFPPFELMYNSDPLNEMIAEVLQAQWQRELGVEVRLRNLEWGSYLGAQRAHEYDLSRSSWIGDYLDPNTFLDVFLSDGPNNRTGWRNADYDRLIEEAATTADAAARARLLHDADLVVLEEMPIIPIFYYVTDGMAAEDVMGLGGNA